MTKDLDHILWPKTLVADCRREAFIVEFGEKYCEDNITFVVFIPRDESSDD